MIIKKQINYEKNRINTDIKNRSIKNTRRKIHHALNGKTKSSSTIDFLSIDRKTYRKWIKYQMTPEMNWQNIESDHRKPIGMFDVSKDEELKEPFC